jgi:hypothetical protein
MKTAKRRLSLDKETVRNLSHRDLVLILGGRNPNDPPPPRSEPCSNSNCCESVVKCVA